MKYEDVYFDNRCRVFNESNIQSETLSRVTLMHVTI
jgi:hypothetical protein